MTRRVHPLEFGRRLPSSRSAGMDPIVRNAMIGAAALHLLYGGTDVVLGGMAFCITWRFGSAVLEGRRPWIRTASTA